MLSLCTSLIFLWLSTALMWATICVTKMFDTNKHTLEAKRTKDKRITNKKKCKQVLGNSAF